MQSLRPAAVDGISAPSRESVISTEASWIELDRDQAEHQELLDELVRRLLACAAMLDSVRHGKVLERLPADIRMRIADGRDALLHVDNIVSTCSAFPDGLPALHRALA